MKKRYKKLGVALLCISAIYMSNKLYPEIGVQAIPGGADKEYVLLAANDLGMHCMQKDYSSFLILPPANTLKVQIFEKGNKKSKLVTSGIRVTYEIIDNTTSADKINFWEYAKDYGYDVSKDVGITGNRLKGEMKLSPDNKYFEATAIPVTPYNDNSKTENPYQLAKVTVEDLKTNKLLVMEDKIVVPVSDEMKCSVCHGDEDTDLNILKSHDKLSGTQLVSDLEKNKRYKCSTCHEDNIIGEKGQDGVLPFSQAMHGFHANKMGLSSTQNPSCYSCHPGPLTQCYRGIMKTAGITCGDANCHGDMAKIASSQAAGREAWLQEPTCQQCHENKYSTNPDKLYRNSYLNNSPAKKMDGKIQCEACHNSPHAEWKSELSIDNKLPESIQGSPSPINKCGVCHSNQKQGKMHQPGGEKK